MCVVNKLNLKCNANSFVFIITTLDNYEFEVTTNCKLAFIKISKEN